MRRDTERRWSGIAILLVLTLPGGFIGSFAPMAGGAPSVKDLGTGNKTVSWNFTDPADYVATNVSLAGTVELNVTSGQLVHDSDQEFAGNGTWDATNLSVSGGLVASMQYRKDLVVNGTFNSSLPWGYVNGTDLNTSSFWDASNGTATVLHNRPAPPALQFDGLNNWSVNNWSPVQGGAPGHVINYFGYDTLVFWEPNASMRFDVDFKNSLTSWVGMERTGLWDWSPYNDFSAWMNTTYTGPTALRTYIHVEAGATMWDSAQRDITPGWKRYDFDIAAFPGNLAGITRITIRFANVRNQNGVSIWVDDCWLYRFESALQNPSIYQVTLKDYFTDSSPTTVSLSFQYRVTSIANLTDANLTASIDNTVWLSPPIPTFTPTGWTQAGPYDISSALSGRGMFNLSFVVSLSYSSPFASVLRVSIDNVSLTVPDYHNGTYVSIPLDLGHPFFLDNISFASSSHPDTNVTVEVRGGWSNQTDDGSWTPWEQHFSSPEILLNNSSASFLQYRLILNTTNASAAVSFDWIKFEFHRYADGGSVQTVDWSPPETLIGWRRFDANYTAPPFTSVDFYISNDTGSTWYSVLPGDSLDTLGGNTISLKAEIETLNTTYTPELFELNVTYEFLGPLFKITVSPPTWSDTADDQISFTAKANDQWGHRISPFVPDWTDDDPAGSVDSSGLYQAGTEGDWHVCASSLGVIDCANVTVSHGRLVRIEINPTSAIVMAKTTRLFGASGFDAVGNDVPLTDTSWTTDVGNFSSLTPASALFMAVGVPDVGHVWAMHDSVSGLLVAEADVTVTASNAVVIQGLVPNQSKPEDSPPWQLDMTPYLPPGPRPNDLMWNLEDKNEALFTVLGERHFGQHVLTFYPKQDAFGDNDVTLWLEDRIGARDSQPLLVSLTPVNDPPVFYDVPRLQIKAGVSYVFDYSPYVYDVDTPKDMLILSTDDQTHTKTVGLTVNYTYDSSYTGQTVMVRLRISDGSSSSSTIQLIDIVGGDNACPHVLKPLPPVSMFEDVPNTDAFPDILQNYFGDADGDPLTYSFGHLQHMMISTWTAPPNYIHVNITSELDWYGIEYLTARATDPSGCFAEQTVRVTVVPVNDPPVLDWHDDIYIKRDMPYNLDLTDFVSDVDNPMSELTLDTNNTILATVEFFNIHLLATYQIGLVTSLQLSLSLTDGQATVWSNVTVRIGTNEPPMLRPGTSLPDVTFNEDTQAVMVFDLDSYFADADGPQPLTYSVLTETVIAQVDNSYNYVNFSAPPNWNGQEVVHVRASDGLGFVIGRLTVRVIPVNDAPVIDPMPDWDFGDGGIVAIDLRQYVHDVDNNITELRFNTNTPHATTVGYILILDYQDGAASEIVTLTVNDTMLNASRSFTVTTKGTLPDNPPPLWAQILWPWSIIILVILAAIGAVAYNRVLDRRYTMEDAFLVGKEGRLIMHTTRHLMADRDEDILAGMLTAIQMFIKDSFREEGGDLRNFQFGDNQVLVDRGERFYFAAMYSGEPPETAADSMTAFTADIEASFGPILDGWSGDADELKGLRSLMDAFTAHRRYRKGDFKKFVKRA